MSESANDMPSTGVALKDSHQPARQDTRTLRIQGKLKAAIDKMVWEGMPFNEAAKAVNFSVGSMRKAFSRPHVLAYIKAERQVLRESISPSNIHRLREIRDAANNMPAIQAIRTLEQMDDIERAHGAPGSASASPGVTIRIINQAPVAPMIDVTPDVSQSE